MLFVTVASPNRLLVIKTSLKKKIIVVVYGVKVVSSLNLTLYGIAILLYLFTHYSSKCEPPSNNPPILTRVGPPSNGEYQH